MADEVKFLMGLIVAVVLFSIGLFISVSYENYNDTKIATQALKLGYTQVYMNGKFVWQPNIKEVK